MPRGRKPYMQEVKMQAKYGSDYKTQPPPDTFIILENHQYICQDKYWTPCDLKVFSHKDLIQKDLEYAIFLCLKFLSDFQSNVTGNPIEPTTNKFTKPSNFYAKKPLSPAGKVKALSQDLELISLLLMQNIQGEEIPLCARYHSYEEIKNECDKSQRTQYTQYMPEPETPRKQPLNSNNTPHRKEFEKFYLTLKKELRKFLLEIEKVEGVEKIEREKGINNHETI
jgi:hypothetical protein